MKPYVRTLSFGLVFYVAMLLLGGFSTVNPDGMFRLLLTHSLLTEGSFVPPGGPILYAPLQSILMVPAYTLGYFYGVLNDAPSDLLFSYGSVACYFLYLPVVVSALLVVFFKVLKEMKVEDDIAIFSTFVLFWGTFLLPYSKGMFSDPLNALLVLASFYYFLRAQSGSYLICQRKNFFCLSLLVLNKFVFVLYFGLMLAYALWDSRVRRKNPGETWLVVREGVLILGAGVLLFLGYNYLRFGQWFNFGYAGIGFTNNLMVGLQGLLFSFGKGLIVFSPVTVLCIFFFLFKNREMESGHRYLVMTSLISFVCFLMVYAKWSHWHGGICWGPRFLLPFVPLFHVLFPFLWQSISQKNWVLRAGVVLAIGWGFGLNLVHTADPQLANQIHEDIPFLDQVFLPEKSVVFQIVESGMDSSQVLKGLLVFGGCIFLLWIWKKMFCLGISASKLSVSEVS